MNAPELLAPAGSQDALAAAVANGADAVYLGLSRLNARQRATNFTPEQLPETIAYLHNHNVRGYITLNTLAFSEELPQVVAYVEVLAEAGVDAVIVQDLGVAALIHRLAPTLPIHASTQMTLSDPRSIDLIRQLGIQRVILPRELSLKEIETIRQTTDMPLEVFIHGAMCLSYSGQCLASHLLHHRSGNRGACAQPCRYPYSLLVDGQEHPSPQGDFLLSMKDLAAWEQIPALVKLGVRAFKIEGRLKDAGYVAAATHYYRLALDAAIAGRPFSLSPQQRQDLQMSFSRGFGPGWLAGRSAQDQVDRRSSSKHGIRIGTVSGTTRQGVRVLLEGPSQQLPIKKGDGVVFADTPADSQAPGGRIYSIETPDQKKNTPSEVTLTFAHDKLDLRQIAPGCGVWKTDDPELQRQWRQSYSRDVITKRTPLHATVTITSDNRLELCLRGPQDQVASVVSDEPLSPAIKHPLTKVLLTEQLSRLGDTPYSLSELDLIAHGQPCEAADVMAPKSLLNQLRRQAIEALEQSRTQRSRHELASGEILQNLRSELIPQPSPPEPTPALFSVLIRRAEQLALLVASGMRLERYDLDIADPLELRQAVAMVHGRGLPFALATPRILKPGEEPLLQEILELNPDAILVRNLGSLRFFRERAAHLPLIGDAYLNVVNELTTGWLKQQGLARLTPGYDLSAEQFQKLLDVVPSDWLEPVIYGRAPLFHTEYCYFAAASAPLPKPACQKTCRTQQLLLEHRQHRYPITADRACRNTLWSDPIQTPLPLLESWQQKGLCHFRLEFLDEKPAEINAVIQRTWAALQPEGEKT